MIDDVEALKTAARLEALGITVRSSELLETAQRHQAFVAAGGNRAMRRAAKRAQRKRGR